MGEGAPSLLRDVVVGAGAALRSPRLIERSLRTLLEPPELSRRSTTDSTRAIWVSQRMLRILAMLPGSYWRNTCLYRSVAECVVRRSHGSPARVVIGVGNTDDQVVAHSWVELLGASTTPDDMAPLRPARAGTAGH